MNGTLETADATDAKYRLSGQRTCCRICYTIFFFRKPRRCFYLDTLATIIAPPTKKPYEDKFHGVLQDLRVKTLKTRRVSRSTSREIAGLFRVSWNICRFAQNAEPRICLTSTGETRAVLPYSASRLAPTNGEPVPRAQRV